jgi:hypothetical protein
VRRRVHSDQTGDADRRGGGEQGVDEARPARLGLRDRQRQQPGRDQDRDGEPDRDDAERAADEAVEYGAQDGLQGTALR